MECDACSSEMELWKELPRILIYTCPEGCMIMKVIKDKEFQPNCIHHENGTCKIKEMDCFGCNDYKSNFELINWANNVVGIDKMWKCKCGIEHQDYVNVCVGCHEEKPIARTEERKD